MCTQKVIYVSLPDKRVKSWLTGFGAGWLSEYLPMLQPRQKWFGVSPNINVGDLILIKDESVKRGCWPKAIVDECYPDADGVLLRDIRKICLLEGHL